MKQVEIAKTLGVSKAYVTMLMNGKRKPSKQIVNKLKLMDVNISKLITNGVQEVAGSSPATPISSTAILVRISAWRTVAMRLYTLL